MDIDCFRAFLAVAKYQSFSLAAEQLYITQPAVSKRILSLESQLDAKLFDRINRQVRLTEAGTALLPKANRIIAALDEAKRTIHDLSGDVRGELHVATSHHVGLHKLPPMLRKFSANFPEVNLKFEFLDSEVAYQRVARGVCELAVVTISPFADNELEVTPLWRDELSFVTSPLYEFDCSPSLDLLSELPAILPDLNTFTGRIIKRCFDQRQLPLTINMSTNYLETIKMLCSVGLGWSVLPDSMIDHQLKRFSIDNIKLHRDLGVLHHPQRSLSNAAHAFFELLLQDTIKT